MSNTLRPYLDCIKSTLNCVLTLRSFPSETVDCQTKPEVEISSSKYSVFNPIHICRTEKEQCLIERSLNSVRISIKIKQIDTLEEILCKIFSRFLMRRANQFVILRKKPIEGYDISFLITNSNLDDLDKNKVIAFIIQFMEEIDKELSSMKISVNSRARLAANSFMKSMAI